MKLWKCDGKYYIAIDGSMEEVSKEVFDTINRDGENMRAKARREHKCMQSDFRKCPHDCSGCIWATEGNRIFSYDKDTDADEPFINNFPEAAACLTSMIEDKIYLEQLKSALAKTKAVPHGEAMLNSLLNGVNKTELSKELGYSRQQIYTWLKQLAEFIREFDR